MSVLPPNFRFLCTLSIRDFSDIASYVNGGTPLKPTKILCSVHSSEAASILVQ